VVRHDVVLVTYGRAAELPPLLAALKSQTRPPDRIVVVDDTPDDSVAKVAAAHGVEYRRNPGPPSITTARNHGIDATAQGRGPGDLLTFLDNDSLPEPDYLQRIQEAAARDPAALGYMGLVTDMERIGALKRLFAATFQLSRPTTQQRCWMHPAIYTFYPVDLRQPVQTNWVWGCNMTFPRRVLQVRFNDQFPRYAFLEDLEYCAHLLQAFPGGHFVMDPAARIRHAKSPADRIARADRARMRVVHRAWIHQHYGDRRWYRKAQMLWSDLGTAVVFGWRTPSLILPELAAVLSAWSSLRKHRKALAHGDLGPFNARYGFARTGKSGKN
jgi:GT2 family glycosyltransferase